MQSVGEIISAMFSGNRPLTKDEYIGDDGLIHCRKCSGARQGIIDTDTLKGKYPLRCPCQEEYFRKRRAAKSKEDREFQIERNREQGIEIASYRNYTFAVDDGQTPNITKTAKNYVENFDFLRRKGMGLLLWGNVGTGKTFLAMCIANALIDKGYHVKHTSLAAVIKMAQEFDHATENFRKITGYDCIVIDDIGTERTTAFGDEQIFKFIDACNTRRIPLIITTNHMPRELEAVTADGDVTRARIYSRILEKCFPIKVNAVRRRIENAIKEKAEMAKLLGIEK